MKNCIKRKFSQKNRKKGFTLLESIVSVALFAIMALMFATIMFTSTKMVNLSLAYDRDREALIEAIETGSTEDITITTVSEGDSYGEFTYQTVTLELSNPASSIEKKVTKNGVYYIYELNGSNVRYCIYVGN